MKHLIYCIVVSLFLLGCKKNDCSEMEVLIDSKEITSESIDVKYGDQISLSAKFKKSTFNDPIAITWKLGSDLMYSESLSYTIKETTPVEVTISNGKCTMSKKFILKTQLYNTISCSENIEPNDNTYNSVFVTSNSTISSSFNGAYDIDYYQFETLPGSTNVYISLKNGSSNCNITLYDKYGNTIANSTTAGDYKEIFYNSSISQKYYVAVSNYSYSYSGCYDLKISTTNSSFCLDTYEYNDNINYARGFYGSLIGKISNSTDVDWFNYYNYSAANRTVTLSNLPQNYNLYIYNIGGTLLYSSTNSGTTNEQITFPASAYTNYYIRIAPSSGAYSITSCYYLTMY